MLMRIRLVAFHGSPARFRATDRAKAKTDLLFFHVDLDDFEVVFETLFELGGAIAPIASLGDVAQPLDSLCDFDKCAELRRAQNLAVHHVAHSMRRKEAFPDIRLQLLDAQRKTAVLRLDTQNHSLHLLAL